MTPLQKAVARAKVARAKAGLLSPLERIVALPTQRYEGKKAKKAHQKYADKWTVKLRRNPHAPPLRPIQGWLCEAIWRFNRTPRGVMGAIGVGHGKTLGTLLAGTVAKSPRTLLLIPASARDQYERDLMYWLRHYRFIPPTTLTYGQLSHPNSSALIAKLQPTLIVADESHMLRHATSARTKRVRRYLESHPQTRYVAVSGTITSDSVMDYAHQLDWCLRDLCPLPQNYHDRVQWAACMDVDGEPAPVDWDATWGLVEHYDPFAAGPWDLGKRQRKEAFQSAFKQRFRSTPGVVSTSDASVDAGLVLRHFRPEVPEVIDEALDRLESLWEMPDGEPITEAVDYYRNARHLSLGFYYKRVWPGGQKDHEWLEARRAWWSAVRQTLRYSAREGLDSPALIAEWAKAGDASETVLEAWRQWEPVKGRAPPPSEAVWLTDEILQAVVRWRTRNPDTIVWYQSRAVGVRLYELGFDVYGQGSKPPRGLGSDPLVAASIRVHGKIQNLQPWSDQLVIEPPSSGGMWEQLLGRTHRLGQKADEVRAAVLTHTAPLKTAVEIAIAKAKYIERTTGQRQKLVFCTWKLDVSI